MKHPITQSIRRILIYSSIWGVIIILHVLSLSWLYELPIEVALTDGIVFNLLYAFLGLALWYPALYNEIDKQTFSNLAVNHLSIMALALVFWISIGIFTTKSIFINNESYLEFLEKGLPWRVFLGIFYYLATVLLYYLNIYEYNLKEHIIQESLLREKVSEAELNTLKSQINPHFLFNSLNSIGSLTITNPQKAHQMIIKLSGFLRYSLAHDPTKLIPLRQEIENMEAYIAVEKVRFGEKLVFVKDIEPGCEDINVPFLIIQPLIENSIKHGVYESTEPVEVKLSCECLGNQSVKITVVNGFDPEAIHPKGTGTGLKNIQERMRIIYQLNDLFSFKKYEKHFEVNLIIPRQKAIGAKGKSREQI